MPMKTPMKLACVQEPEQFPVVGQIERRLGGELERIVVLFEPNLQLGQERLDRLLIADEVIVDEIDVAAVAETIQRLQLVQHLRIGLGAGHAPVKLDNVAELAGERAAARKLHADVKIMLDLQEIESRNRGLGDVDGELFGLEDAVAGARIPGRDELVDDALGFAEHLEICLAEKRGHRGHARPADDHRLAPRPAQIDDRDGVEILRQHAAGHDHIGPFEIAVGQFLGVAVDQPNGPFAAAAAPPR